MNRKDVWSEKTGTNSAEGEMRRKEKENFTRRRFWWSKRRDETGVRDSETKGRDKKTKGGRKKQNGTRKGGILRGNIHMRDRERKREHKACFLLDQPSHPQTTGTKSNIHM